MLGSRRSPPSYAVIGALLEVHSILGPGFLESVYHAAVRNELSRRQIPFESEVVVRIRYKGDLLEPTFRLDLLCFGKLVVELKAQKLLTSIDEAQVLNYLRATGHNVAILANFGEESLAFRRLVLGDGDGVELT